MIFYFLSFLLKSYIGLNAFQRHQYEDKAYYKFIVKNIIILFAIDIIFLISFYSYKNIIILSIPFLLIQFLYILKQTKVYLKFTNRAIRICVVYLTLSIVLSIFIPFCFLDIISLFFIPISNVFLKPYEFINNKRFIKKAKNKVNSLNAIKIAITGSYGKTSVKHYLTNVLKNRFIVKSSPKSFNTPLGLSRFINQSEFNFTDFIIYEFGARRKGDIQELIEIFNYDIAIVTAIGTMHIDTFGTIENIIEEKMSIVNHLKEDGIAILNYENEYIRNYQVLNTSYTYGFNYGDYQAKNIELGIFGSKFDLYYNNTFIESFIIKPLGKGAILNVLPTIIILKLYNLPLKLIEEIAMVDNRLSLRKFGDYFILDDGYNSNILGATYALEVLKTFNGRRFIITPGFSEMDKIKNELALEYAKQIDECTDYAILVKNKFTILLSKNIKKCKLYFVNSFKEGFNLFLKLKVSESILLIENDLLE